jgi:hypothetical protein
MNTSEVLELMTQPLSGPAMGWIQLPIEYAKVVTSIADKLDAYELAVLVEFGKQIYQAGDKPRHSVPGDSLLT